MMPLIDTFLPLSLYLIALSRRLTTACSRSVGFILASIFSSHSRLIEIFFVSAFCLHNSTAALKTSIIFLFSTSMPSDSKSFSILESFKRSFIIASSLFACFKTIPRKRCLSSSSVTPPHAVFQQIP